MNGPTLRFALIMGVMASLAAGYASPASADFIVNGDFEDTTGWTSPPNAYPTTSTAPAGWQYLFVLPTGSYSAGLGCAAEETAGALGGSYSAKIDSFGDGDGEGGDHDWQGLYQSVGSVTHPVAQKWQFDVDVDAVVEGAARPLQCFLAYGDAASGDSPSGGLSSIDLRVTSSGGLDVYHSGTGSGWHTVFAAGTIDVDSLEHISILGDFDALDGTSTPTYAIGFTDEDGTEWSTPFSYWYGSAPTASQSIVAVLFPSNDSANATYSAYTSTYLVDNVTLFSIPEPGTWTMLVGSLSGLLVWRRVRGRRRREEL